MLVHSSCGGDIGIDKGKPAFIIKGDLFYPVKCLNCGQRLGVLPMVDDISTTQSEQLNRMHREDAWQRAQIANVKLSH